MCAVPAVLPAWLCRRAPRGARLRLEGLRNRRFPPLRLTSVLGLTLLLATAVATALVATWPLAVAAGWGLLLA